MGRHAYAKPGHQPTELRRRRHSKAWGLPVTALVVVGVMALGAPLLQRAHTVQTAQLTASTATVPLLGSSVKSAGDLAQVTAQFGHMPIVRVYFTGLPPANAWTTGLAGANKSAVIVSFKAQPTTILSGADDAALSQFFDSAPTGHPIYFSYYHEPEDNIAAGQFTLADYKAAWAHIAALADAAHNPDLHATLILMEWDLQKASGRNWLDYLPGGGIIKVLGWDAYPQGSATNVNPQPTPPADFMGPAIAASKSVGLPYGFAEFGLSTPVGRSAWLTTVGNYVMNSGALFGTLYNGDQQYPTLQLTGSTEIGIWRQFVATDIAALSVGSSPSVTPSTSPSATPSSSPSGTPSSSPSGTPSSSPSGTPSSSPASGLAISGLTVNPAVLSAGASRNTAISFTLNQTADITVCILDANGSVRRTISRPAMAAGLRHIPYYGFNGQGKRLPAGQYRVLVVASNATGSATAEASLNITG
jgi:hypothetical protein